MPEPIRTKAFLPTDTLAILFTDIEGSTVLWEKDGVRMSQALAAHDTLARCAVAGHRGTVVKTTGDGMHAVFDDALDALAATVALQQALADPVATNGVPLRVRCGLHAGVVERRDNDYFGSSVNRAARIMSAAHGGQVLLSQVVVDAVRDRLAATVVLRDLGNVRLKDLSTPEHVYQLVHPDLRQDFPALRSLEATPNNLPQLVTSFIGREREQSEVEELLEKSRLLTLLGVGGLGKTRLSLQVAANTLDEFPDGVWFVELASLNDGRLVAQAVASVLGVKEEAGRPVAEALAKHLHDRQLLIILDNCEHLAQACAELATKLLRAGPGLKILASSREHLNVAGEVSYQVPALAAPEPHRAITFADMTQYAAVRLFAERAAAAQPAFQITLVNATAIADICHRLDGIPLAIELAAARMRALAVETIAERLDDRFRLLTNGDRTVLPRQQTLRALIDWSYDLLTENERALFRRLAVFAGGFTLEAAEAVGAEGDLVEVDVLDLVSLLVEKSLVVADLAVGRYRLLETVRQYARGRLDESLEGDRTRARHLAYYLAFAEEGEMKLRGPEQGVWLSRFADEQENLLSAHAWCDHADGGAQMGLTLAWAVQDYWFNRGLLELGHRLTVEALSRAGAMERNPARWRALATAGDLSYWMGRYGEATSHLEECLSIARESGDSTKVAGVLMLLGRVSHGRGDLTAARGHLEESLALARQPGGERRLPSALNSLADLHRAEGELDAAVPLYEESLALRRKQRDGSNIAVNLLSLAMISIGRGVGNPARGPLLEALAIAEETGSKRIGQLVLDVSAGLWASVGIWDRAARFYGAAEAQREQMGLQREPVDAVSLAPLIAQTRAALGDTTFATAESAGRALSYAEAMLEARTWLASAN